MMTGLLFAGMGGELEIRRARDGSTRLQGSFPYGSPAVLSDGGRTGRPRKEVIAPRAFAFRVDDPEADIRLLVGHDFNRPLASKSTGTLTLRDSAVALFITAIISAEVGETTHGRDALALISAGLATGISPGFRLPPERAVPRDKAETITQEPDNPDEGQHQAIIRTIHEALLFELSIVSAAAYPAAQIEARSWDVGDAANAPLAAKPKLASHLLRWRL